MATNILTETHFRFPQQTAFYKGKVRDVYTIADDLLVMITTDRISAFDVVLPRGIPFKGQVLNQIASYFLDQTADIVPNWKMANPDPVVTIGRKCKPFAVEMVIRGYLTGSAWRNYQKGNRLLCGITVPDQMREHQRFASPIITPSTKADEGHDEDISKEEIIRRGLVSANDYAKIEQYTYNLFKRGSEMAAKQGLIMVDTKYEFGKRGNEIFLIDEIHTPDSSRYFIAAEYQQRFDRGEAQKQLSKEFVREWLMQNGFQGQTGQDVPPMDDNYANRVSERYIELFEKLTGKAFVRADSQNIVQRIENNVMDCLQKLGIK